MKIAKKSVVLMSLFVICADIHRAFCDDNLVVKIENADISELFAIPFIVNDKEDIRIHAAEPDNEQQADEAPLGTVAWIFDRKMISEKFRMIIANGHLGLSQCYVYYEDFNLSKVGKELKVKLKSYEINIDILVDPLFLAPKHEPNSGVEVLVRLFKIDEVGEVGEVLIIQQADEGAEHHYKTKISVYQPGNYWLEVRYKGGKIRGKENEYLGYPVWGKIINVSNEPINLRIVGDKSDPLEPVPAPKLK